MTTLERKRKVSVVSERIESEGEEDYCSADEQGSDFDGGEEDFEDDSAEVDSTDEEAVNPEEESSETVPQKNKKPKTESRADAKKLKLERQAHRPHNEVVQEAKKLWERVRRRDLTTEQRSAPLAQLFALLTGKFKEVIAKHDASRMIQTCIKYGNSEQRLLIATELKGAYPAIAKSRYGKHIVNRLLQYCSSMRKSIVAEFRGQVAKMIRSVDAASVLEEVYSEYANAREKNALLMEFYGPEFNLFRKSTDTAAIPTLSELLKQKPDCRERILKAIRESLDALVNKGNLGHSIIHRLMLEYAQHEEITRLQDWISTFDEKLVEILHTLEGARVVARCLAVATTKQKKTIVKSLKQYIKKIACEEYGHQVLLSAFTTVDDTVLVRNCIVSELLKDLPGYLANRHAQRLIAFLLSGPSVAGSVLTAQSALVVRECEAAALAAGTSKKDAPLRAAELRADLAGPVSVLVLEKVSDGFFSASFECLLLLEAALVIDDVSEGLIDGYFCRPEMYDSADFRAFAKKFARRCSVEQGQTLLAAMSPSIKEIVEGDGAFVIMALHASKPELRIEPFETQNEHALKLFSSFQ
jgi:pumilio family protein 6